MAALLALVLAVSLMIHKLGGGLADAVCIAALLAQRSLYDHVRAVYDALAAFSIGEAREKVSRIVGRDVAALDAAGIARAAIESLAESFSDGVAAPLFWAACFGLPGIAVYKAINTADSMIGHKDERYRAYGWAAARLDDAANLIPARLSGLLIVLAAGWPGASAQGAWRCLRRDARKHASPNAGWPEAAMAGALGLRLGGPQIYDGMEHGAAFIGQGTREATRAHVRLALRLYVVACGLLWLMLLLTWRVSAAIR